MHLGHVDVRLPAVELRELLGVARLLEVVDLLVDELAKLLDDRLQVNVTPQQRNGLRQQSGELPQDVDVERDALLQVRALHLDGNCLAALEEPLVHLTYRRGRDGRGVHAVEHVFYPLAQLRLDDGERLGVAERLHAVLQLDQLAEILRREQVRAARQRLPSLDEGRPERRDELHELARALRAHRLLAPAEHVEDHAPEEERDGHGDLEVAPPDLEDAPLKVFLGGEDVVPRPCARSHARARQSAARPERLGLNDGRGAGSEAQHQRESRIQEFLLGTHQALQT